MQGELEGYKLSDSEVGLMVDEGNILESMKYKQRASFRAQQVFAWQAIV
jgi:hypothetical protein